MREHGEHNVYSNRYTLVYGVYHAGYAASVSFGMVFLLACGFDSGMAGTIMAAATMLSIVVQQPLAAFADHSTKMGIHQLMAIVTLVVVPLCLFLYFVETPPMVAVGIAFLLIYCIAYVLQSLINGLGMQLSGNGIYVNYGVSRAISCIVYASMAWSLGFVSEWLGVRSLMLIAALFYGVMLLMLATFPMPKGGLVHEPAGQKHESLFRFFARYPKVMVVILCIILVSTGYFFYSVYSINVFNRVGGGDAEVGIGFCIIALVECVPLMLYSRLLKHFSVDKLMKWGTLSVPLKGIAIMLASTVPTTFLAHFCHIGYGLFVAGTVYYINAVVRPEDRVQGQAAMVAASLLGNVIVSLLGGWGIELWGVTVTGWLANAVGVVGAVGAFIAIGRIELYHEPEPLADVETVGMKQMGVLHEGGKA